MSVTSFRLNDVESFVYSEIEAYVVYWGVVVKRTAGGSDEVREVCEKALRHFQNLYEEMRLRAIDRGN